MHDLLVSNATLPEFEKTFLSYQMKLYFFNVTNPEAFNGSLTSLHFEQIGPYVYDEERQKIYIEWKPHFQLLNNQTLDAVSYSEHKVYRFNAELSRKWSGKALNSNDTVTIINMALVNINTENIQLSAFFLNFQGLPEVLLHVFTSVQRLTITDTVQNIAFNGAAAWLMHSLLMVWFFNQ